MRKIARAAVIASILVCGFFTNFYTAHAGYNFWKWLNFGSDRDSTDFTVFIENKSPNAPTLVSPADGASTNDATPELSVNYSDGDAGDTGTTNYRIALSAFGCSENTSVVASGTSAATSTNSEATTWNPASSIGADGTYFWCAQNNDGTATSAWTAGDGDGWSFILDTDEPLILSGSLASDNSSVTINFSSAVYSNADGSGDLTAADFALAFTQNSGGATAVSVASITHTSGGTSAVVNLTITGLPSGMETIEITPADSASIFDIAGNPVAATQTSGSKTLNDSLATTIVDITSDTADGSYAAGTTIDLNVTFSEAVTSTGNVTLTLETGTLDRQCYFSISNSDFATCNYIVQAGDVSADLEVSSVAGTIADAAGNAVSNFTPATNLAANKNLLIDGTVPDIEAVDAGASSADRISLESGTWFKASDAGDDDQISFSWTDPSSLSDDTFYYELNSTATITISGNESSTATNYIDSIAITEGTNYFHVRPKNGATTFGTERTFTVNYDKTNPTTSAEVTAGTEGDNSWYTTNATVTITPADATAGVASTVYCVDQADNCTPTTSYTATFEVSTEDTNYVRYFSTDNAGNIQAAQSLTVKVDKTAPATGSTVHTDGYETDTTIAVAVVAGTDSNSGMSADDSDYFLEYRSATLTTGNCGGYGSWLDSGAAETAAATNYNFTSTTGNCYQFRYTVEDAAGNSTTYTSDDTTKVDTTTPDILAVDAGASSIDRVSLTSGSWFKASDIGSDDAASFSWTDPNSASDDTFYYDYADEGLVGWWQMDESLWNGTANEVVDSSGSGNHGVRAGDATTTSSGKIVSGGSFDGDDDYINFGDILDLGTDDATLSAWIKTEGTVDYCNIVGKPYYGDINGRYSLHYIGTSGTIGIIIDSPSMGNLEVVSTSTVNDNEWHFITAVIDRDVGIELFIDGISNGTDTGDTSSDNFDNNLHFNIGYYTNDVNGYFNGSIDEVKIWNRALSADEIAAEYAARDGTANAFHDSQALREGDGDFHVRPVNGVAAWGTERSFNVKYDKMNPTATAPVDEGAVSADQILEFTWTAASDATAGLASLTLCIDDDKTDDCAKEVSLATSAVGYDWSDAPAPTWGTTYYAKLIVVDNAGNSTTTGWSDGVTPDGAPPTVSADKSEDSWYAANQTVTLSAADAESGLAQARYVWDENTLAADCSSGGTTFTNGTEIIFSTEGDHTLYLCAVDNADNANTWSGTYKLDKTDPAVQTTTLTSPNGGEIWTGGGAVAYDVTWTAADFTDSISGLAANPITLEYSINSGADWTSIATNELNDGTYSWTTPDLSDSEVRIRITATDLAGNTASDTSAADFRLSAHDNWIVLHLIGGDDQVGGLDETLSTELKMRVGNGADSLETFTGADNETVTFTLYSVPETPTAVGQALANGSFGTTFGGTSVVKTISTDASGYVSTIFTLGDRAGDYSVVANFTGCETAEADRTFAATEREEFKFTISDTTSHLDIDPAANTSDSAPTTLSVTTNAASFQITVDPNVWPTNATSETIGNWLAGLGFGWDNNNSGTTGGVSDTTAFSGGLAAFTVYTCSGDSCQGTQEFTLDLHAAIDYTYEAGTYQNAIEVAGISINF